ncbi:MAG: ubiquitin-like domain-containing protein [Clostridia bacterium]|nr:ubiquitin-like domain-containing protein [Clostridia bacterium]
MIRRFTKKVCGARKRAIALVTATVLFAALSSAAAFATEKTVILNDNGKTYEYKTMTQTVATFFEDNDIKLVETDAVSPGLLSPTYDGIEITIERAKAVVIVTDGEVNTVETTADTVEQLLLDENYYVGAGDSVTPALSASVLDGMTVEIERAKLVTFTREGGTWQEYSFSDTVKEFLQEVGIELDRYERTEPSLNAKITDGITVDIIYEKPDNVITFSNGDTITFSAVYDFVATAYTASAEENGGYAGMSATGIPLRRGIVAVDPKVIPLHSKLYVVAEDGTSWIYGNSYAADTGGAIKGNRIDLLMDTTYECNSFGRRKCKVYVLE